MGERLPVQPLCRNSDTLLKREVPRFHCCDLCQLCHAEVVVGFDFEERWSWQSHDSRLILLAVRTAAKAKWVWTYVRPGPCRRVDSLSDL